MFIEKKEKFSKRQCPVCGSTDVFRTVYTHDKWTWQFAPIECGSCDYKATTWEQWEKGEIEDEFAIS